MHRVNASDLELDSMVYLLDYRKLYADPDIGPLTGRALSELYLFRGWTVQFGYRLFSTDPTNSEAVVCECVNLYRTIGLCTFEATHDIDFDKELSLPIMDAIEARWQTYDGIIFSHRSQKTIPTNHLVEALCDFGAIRSPIAFFSLSIIFLTHLEKIKALAFSKGFIHNG